MLMVVWVRVLVALVVLTSAASAAEYVTARDGHFYRGVDRIRFWGVGIVNPAGWDHREIEYMTHRAAVCGFNALRLHMYDASVFASADPNRPSYLVNDYEKGDGSPMDLVDLMIARADREELYLYMSFSRAWCHPKAADYDVLPAGDEADRKAWVAAVATAGRGAWTTHMYIDERLGEVFLEAARNQLRHVNPYTGLSYAEDPHIAIWEMTNENAFVDSLLNGSFRGLDGYFLTKLLARWNGWLVERYGTTENLREAWSGLNDGESLEDGTIALAPVRSDPVVAAITAEQKGETATQAAGDGRRYTDARARDVVRFVIDLYDCYNQRFIREVRTLAPEGVGINVAPIAITTSNANWSLPCHYANSLGTFSTGGNYEVQFTTNAGDPRYPWQTRLESFPAFAGNTEAQPFEGKPVVGYECNMYRPNPFLAEMPARLGTYAAWNDWDGVFWFGWPGDHHPAGDYASLTGWPLPNCNDSSPEANHIGLTFHNDEVFLSQIKAQGAMFLNFAVPAAEKPRIHVYGRDILYDMFDRSWLDATWLRMDAHSLGARVRVEPDGPSSPWVHQRWSARSAPRDAVPGHPLPLPPTTSPIRAADGQIVYQWSGPGKGGQLVIDSPRCKSVVGWPGERWAFADGWSVEGIRVGAATDAMLPNSAGFGCVTIAANDGRPLTESSEIVVSMVAKSQNTGFTIDPSRAKPGIIKQLATSVVEPGKPPVIVDRVGGTIRGPWPAGARYHKYSFDLAEYESGPVGTELRISPEEPMFYCTITRE